MAPPVDPRVVLPFRTVQERGFPAHAGVLVYLEGVRAEPADLPADDGNGGHRPFLMGLLDVRYLVSRRRYPFEEGALVRKFQHEDRIGFVQCLRVAFTGLVSGQAPPEASEDADGRDALLNSLRGDDPWRGYVLAGGRRHGDGWEQYSWDEDVFQGFEAGLQVRDDMVHGVSLFSGRESRPRAARIRARPTCRCPRCGSRRCPGRRTGFSGTPVFHRHICQASQFLPACVSGCA